MSLENEIAILEQATNDLLDAVNTNKTKLDTAVVNAETAVSTATTQVNLTAAEKVSAQIARDEAESHKDLAYSYSQSAASAVAYQDLTVIAQTKVETAVDVFVYDTSKDSDGGAWRQRTQGTSWYNEPLNTATRGSRKEFPAVAVIVAESGKVTIYDGDDPSMPMWMVFNAGGSTANDVNHLSTLTGVVNSVVANNGIISSAGKGGLVQFKFIKDLSIRTNSSDTVARVGGINKRNSGLGQIEYNYLAIVNGSVNDVAMTVLPNAPIDPATGLPIPTIAVATDGGVSVIKDDGTVVDWTRSSYTVANSVGFRRTDKALVTTFDIGGDGRSRHVLHNIPDEDLNDAGIGFIKGQSDEYYAHTLAPTHGGSDLSLSSSTLPSNQFNGLEDAGGGQLSLLAPNREEPSKGMLAVIEHNYNTGWMNGDIKLATLSDTDDTDLVGSELVTNGTFDTDVSGWTILNADANNTITWSSGAIRVVSDGSSAVGFQQGNLTSGEKYVVTFDLVTTTGGIKVWNGDAYETFSATGSHSLTVDYDTQGIIFYRDGGVTDVTIDNISVRLAEPDRSVNNNGLQVFGTVTREPVATGADLVAYSGFSPSNYLQQPYNPDLDFGTGDFCVMGWFKVTNTANLSFMFTHHTTDNADGGLFLLVFGGNVRGSARDVSDYFVDVALSSANVWHNVVFLRRNGILEMYLDGVFKGSAASPTDIIATSDRKTLVGKRITGDPLQGSLTLLRISATAPTAEQIAKIYRDEKVLFQENAQATLHGTSDAVTALAYDTDTTLLHVGTSSGRSVFSGLQRVDNTTDAVGTAISASNNLVVEE